MYKFPKIFSLAAMLALAACSSDDGVATSPPVPAPAPEKFNIQVLHASPDAPAVNVLVNGSTAVPGLEYKQGSAAISLAVGSYDIQVDGNTPGGMVTVIPSTNLTFVADTLYSVVAVGDVANIEPVILEQPDGAVTAGNAQVRILHAAPLAPQVTVYATAPGADLTTEPAVGTFSFKEDLGPIQVPAGDYQIRVTLANQPGSVVFDSGPITLGDGNDLLVAAVENTTAGSSAPISLAVLDTTGSSEILDIETLADLRVVHASPDAPAVDIVVNDDLANPLVPGIEFPDFTGFVSVPADDYNVKVVEPVSGLTPIDVNLSLEAGVTYTVVALDTLAGGNITALVADDDPRRVATEAKVRLIHASPTAGNVDIWVTAEGADITAVPPLLTDVPLGANTGFLSLAEGIYDVNIAPTGTTVAAITATINIVGGGIYTAIARDAEGGFGGLPLGLILMDDF